MLMTLPSVAYDLVFLYFYFSSAVLVVISCGGLSASNILEY
jgi:hypothetical protein